MPEDNVLRPAHYDRAPIQPLELIEALELGFHEAQVVKYVCRHAHKNGLEDLRKAENYLQRLIAMQTGDERYPPIPENRYTPAQPLDYDASQNDDASEWTCCSTYPNCRCLPQ